MRAIRLSAVDEGDKRAQAYVLLKALDAVRAELTTIMATGRLAADEVEARKRDAAIAATAYGI